MTLPGGTLALDLASTVGWAYGGLRDANPAFGCWKLPPIGGEGARFAAFENTLAAAIEELQPSRMVCEAPMPLQALIGVSTLKVVSQQLGLRAIAYSEAYRASIPISEVSSDMVRYAILGAARFAKGKVKIEVVNYCRSRGWKVPDHNAGDAVLVWLWHKGQLSGSPLAGPLFPDNLNAIN
jgi:Holliday junction resolvasome RuvABC endonuclease subunit